MRRPPGLPRPWRDVIGRTLPPEDREALLREVGALYARRVERDGPRAARRWLRREALGYLILVPAEQVRRRLRDGVAGASGAVTTDLLKDAMRALRSFRRSPGFALVAVVTLTVGIGANTVVFSVVDHVVLRPLPFEDPERLAAVWPSGLLGGEFLAIRDEARSFESVAAYRVAEGFNLELDGRALRVDGLRATAELLTVLGVEPAEGRGFAPEDDEPGAVPTVVLSHGLWAEAFGATPDIVGRPVVLDGVARTVVGVLPEGFSFPDVEPDVVTPLVLDRADPGSLWGSGGLSAVGRLLDGVGPEAAEAELAGLSPRLREANPLWTPVPGFHASKRVLGLRESLADDVRSAMLVLLGAVGLVLLVACANVANLLLARGLARGRDLAVRAALGASRARLVREQLVESVLLGGLGLVAALVAARWALRGVLAIVPAEVPRVDTVTLDGRILAVGMLSALLASVVSGLLPALRGSRTPPAAALRAGGRGGGADPRRRRLSFVLVTIQVTAAVVLVTGAGLLVRSLGRMTAVDPGFDPSGVLTADVTPAGAGFEDPDVRIRFFRDLVERVEALPGVSAAGVASRVPFGAGDEGIAVFVEGVTENPDSLPWISRRRIHPGYLEALGVRLLEGRPLAWSDRADAPLVALVDELAADAFWPGESPVGRRVRYPWAGAPWIEIVGVVGRVDDHDPRGAPTPVLYQPMAQQPTTAATLLVRAGPSPTAVAPAVRAALRELDERVPLSGVASMERRMSGTTARTRWMATLLGFFAAATLLSGTVGVYGVVACTVRERTRDIGVRLALGASRGDVGRAVLGQGLALSLPGAALGLALALPAGRALDRMLFQIPVFDPVTFVIVPVVVASAASAAVYVPARRATRVDPVEALRAEG